MRNRSRWLIATLALVFGVLAVITTRGLARQQESKPVASLLPESTFAYMHWDGTDAHRETWEKSAVYESVVKSGLASGIYKAIVSFVPPAAMPDFENATKVAELITNRGVSLSVASVEESPIPYGVLVLHKSAELEGRLTEFLKKINDSSGEFEERTVNGRKANVLKAPSGNGLEIGWWSEGGHLVITIGINAVQTVADVAEGKTKNITTNALFAKGANNPADFETLSQAWLNVAPLREKFSAIEIPIGGPQNPEKKITVQKVLEILGVDTLGSVSLRSGMKDRAMWSEMFIDAPAPRKGLLSFANQKSITLNDLPPLPANCPGFLLNSFDISEGFDTILGIVKEVIRLGGDEQAVEQVDGGIAQLEQVAGFKLKSELLEPLGHISCVYSDAGQGPLGLGFGIAVSMDDAEKVRTSVDKILDLVQQQAGPNLLVSRAEKQKRQVITLQIGGGFVNPAICIDDKWMLIALSPQSVDTFLMRLDGKLPSWKGGGDFADALKVVPKEFISLSVSDPRVSVQGVMNMLSTMGPAIIAGARQEAQRQGAQLPEGNPLADLPPAELITAPLFPNVSWSTVNDEGISVRERTSLPSLVGAAGVPAAGVGIALLLPAVQQAREAARQAQSKNNLKQIALALHNYHESYNHFPSGAVINTNLAQEKRLSWMVELLPFVEQANVYNGIDRKKAWDDPANKGSLSVVIPVFHHPSVPITMTKDGYSVTNYVGIAGIGKDGPTLPVDDPKAGMFAYDRTTRIGDIQDGTSYTMMVIETKTNVGSWGAAGPSTIRPVTQKPYVNGPDGFGGISPRGANAVMADGSVRFLSDTIDPKVFEAMSTINGHEVNPDLNP